MTITNHILPEKEILEIHPIGNVELAVYYLKLYFDFAYYTGYVHFRFSRNLSTGYYEIRTNRWRKVLACLMQFGTTLYFLKFMGSPQNTLTYTYSKTPPYLTAGSVICTVVYMGCLLYTYLKKSSAFSKIFLEIGENCLSTGYRPPSMRQNFYGALVCLLLLFMVVTNLIIALNSANMDFYVWVESISGILRMTGPIYWLRAAICVLMEIYSAFVSVLGDQLFLLLVYMYWQVTRAFYSPPFPNQSPGVVIANYKILKLRVKLINDGIQYILLGLSIVSVPFLAMDIGTMMTGGANFELLRNLIYVFYVGTSMGVAAHSHAKITQLEEWIHQEEHYNEIPIRDLHVLLHNVNANKCGLTAAGGVFTLSYGFLGSMLILVMGYVVLVVQNGGRANSAAR